jgi:benzoylformate decarboxylase
VSTIRLQEFPQERTMTTVTEQILDVLRAYGITTVFGNPGSTELPFLHRFPADFRYVLGLQEATVIATAVGHALVADQAAVVNVHTTAGMGNAMGAIVTAAKAQAPLIVTAGTQDRRQIRTEPFLWGRQVEFVKPYVKWSVEPHRAIDLPEAFARGYHVAMTEPRGPVFISLCMDGLDEDCAPFVPRAVTYAAVPDPAALDRFAAVLGGGRRIAIVAGEQVDAAGANQSLVTLAERLNAAVFLPGMAWRMSFPTSHDLYQGRLPAAMGPVATTLSPYDTVLVVGADVFLYYPYMEGPVIREGTRVLQVTNDPMSASRAEVGDSVVGNVGAALRGLLARIGARVGSPPARLERKPAAAGSPPKPDFIHQELARAYPPGVMLFDEAPSSGEYLVRRALLDRPKSYFATASGGLGFAMPAAVGAAIAQRERPVVCIVGDGSAQYAIQALWTAANERAPVTFIVLVNGEYGILKSFCQLMNETGVPGLDLPGIDFAGLARGYGVDHRRVPAPDAITAVVKEAIASGRPNMVEIAMDPTIPPLLG